MYFWKIENLKEDIKNNNFTEKDRFIYVFIYIVLGAITMEIMAILPDSTLNIWDYIMSVGSIFLVITGTIFAFKANGGGSGTDFLGRYFSISFVVGIRFFVLLLPMFIALIIYYEYTFSENEEVLSTAGDILPFLLWYALMYWRIVKHIGDVKN